MHMHTIKTKLIKQIQAIFKPLIQVIRGLRVSYIVLLGAIAVICGYIHAIVLFQLEPGKIEDFPKNSFFAALFIGLGILLLSVRKQYAKWRYIRLLQNQFQCTPHEFIKSFAYHRLGFTGHPYKKWNSTQFRRWFEFQEFQQSKNAHKKSPPLTTAFSLKNYIQEFSSPLFMVQYMLYLVAISGVVSWISWFIAGGNGLKFNELSLFWFSNILIFGIAGLIMYVCFNLGYFSFLSRKFNICVDCIIISIHVLHLDRVRGHVLWSPKTFRDWLLQSNQKIYLQYCQFQ